MPQKRPCGRTVKWLPFSSSFSSMVFHVNTLAKVRLVNENIAWSKEKGVRELQKVWVGEGCFISSCLGPME